MGRIYSKTIQRDTEIVNSKENLVDMANRMRGSKKCSEAQKEKVDSLKESQY